LDFIQSHPPFSPENMSLPHSKKNPISPAIFP
jgi:hypothetical protein